MVVSTPTANQFVNMASISLASIQWIHLLEKEFDVGFVDCDTTLANIFATLTGDSDGHHTSNDLVASICEARHHLTGISAAFTQLVHKAFTLANQNEDLTVFYYFNHYFKCFLIVFSLEANHLSCCHSFHHNLIEPFLCLFN